MVPYDKAYEEGFEDMPRRVPDLAKIRAPHRLRAQGPPRRDPGPRDRVLHVGQGAGLTGDAPPSPPRRHLAASSPRTPPSTARPTSSRTSSTSSSSRSTPTYLTATDYGDLALLLLFGTVAKIVFRLGLDAGFFRVHYDMATTPKRGAGWRARWPSSRPPWPPCSSWPRWSRCAGPLTRALLGDGRARARWVVLVAARRLRWAPSPSSP